MSEESSQQTAYPPLTFLEGCRDGTLLAAAGFGLTGNASAAGAIAALGLALAVAHTVRRKWRNRGGVPA